MIAELVRQYETLKHCGESLPDPGFTELPVSIEIILRNDGTFWVDWLDKPDESKKKSNKTIPISDMDCPVTEQSASRSSGNDSPHGLVDNSTWVFGRLPRFPTRNKSLIDACRDVILRRKAFLKQLSEFCDSDSSLDETRRVRDALINRSQRNMLWKEVEKKLRTKIVIRDGSEEKWRGVASKVNIRWVVESIGTSGKSLHAASDFKNAWVKFQKTKANWWLVSCLDGKEKPARLLHPQPKSASLVSFNDPVFYCSHLHPDFREDALGAQIGFDEAEKYALALEWLVDHSSVRFGSVTNCVWVDQTGEEKKILDHGAHELTKCQGKLTIFSRGRAKSKKAVTLADTSDLIQSLRQFRNGHTAEYRNRRFYLLSLLLRRKGRHAILGGFPGTMGELEANTEKFVQCTSLVLPKGFPFKDDRPREFCPTLMDILDASSVKSEKQKQSTWDREVIGVIVHGQHLPLDLCRKVVLNAVRHKHMEMSRESKADYLKLLVVAAGCSRHRLNASGKEAYSMELDTQIAAPGYLAGRLFALCEDIQKKGRGWKATLSDKLFGAAISRPRETLARLYENCRCYDVSRSEDEWFKEILGKVRLSESVTEGMACMPEDGVDSFEFILGYWHQRARIQQVRAENRETHKEGGKDHGTEESNKE